MVYHFGLPNIVKYFIKTRVVGFVLHVECYEIVKKARLLVGFEGFVYMIKYVLIFYEIEIIT